MNLVPNREIYPTFEESEFTKISKLRMKRFKTHNQHSKLSNPIPELNSEHNNTEPNVKRRSTKPYPMNPHLCLIELYDEVLEKNEKLYNDIEEINLICK